MLVCVLSLVGMIVYVFVFVLMLIFVFDVLKIDVILIFVINMLN